ncbi:MAG: DUF29 domain-containing protein [Acetobacteraceae bacterium]
MGDSRYDTDILAWSEHQAALLRRMAAGERINDQVDWGNVIEEIESVGNEQLHAVHSFLVRALEHDLKAEAWPNCRDVPNWRAEARRFRGDAAARFTEAMRQRIDLAKLYRRALRALPDTIDGQPPLPVPQTCPMTLDELLAEP